jgi:long-subunit acyl-CoA synthetase (AMP-forming)
VGEGKRYLTVLLTLHSDALRAWSEEHAKVADYEALTADPDLRAEVERIVAEVNSRRSRWNSYASTASSPTSSRSPLAR